MSVNVYVEAVQKGSGTYGNCNIVISEDDAHRSDFLEDCANFFKMKDRPEDAQKFTQAVRQTPSS